MRYGDHQPEFSPHLLDPGLDEAGIGTKLENYDPRYYATYYAIDAINFEPVKSPAVMDTIDAAYLPLVIQEAAGIPLDPSFAEQKNMHASLQGLVLRLQGRRGGPPLQPAPDRRRHDQGIVAPRAPKPHLLPCPPDTMRGADEQSAREVHVATSLKQMMEAANAAVPKITPDEARR